MTTTARLCCASWCSLTDEDGLCWCTASVPMQMFLPPGPLVETQASLCPRLAVVMLRHDVFDLFLPVVGDSSRGCRSLYAYLQILLVVVAFDMR